VGGNQRLRHLLEVELQAARQNGHRNFLRVGGRQDELDVLRRLFERLQHGIERRSREHVHFVDDIDLEATTCRRVHRILEQLAHLVDLGVGRRVYFEQIDETPAVDFLARRTDAAGRGADAGLAIEGLGQDPGQRRLADATGTGKQIRVVQALGGQRVRQCPHHVLLANQAGKASWAPFARQDLVAHERILADGTDDSGSSNGQKLTICDLQKRGHERKLAEAGEAEEATQNAAKQAPGRNEGGEPYPRHSHKTAVAASFRT